MGVKMTGRLTARAYAKRDPYFRSSGPIILAKINLSNDDFEDRNPCSGQSRITTKIPCQGNRRHYNLLSFMKRWITNIWYSIFKRAKSMFSTREVDPDQIPRSNSTGKIPSEMDSELENNFWREGIQRSSLEPRTNRSDRSYFGRGDYADVDSLYGIQQTSKISSSDDSETENYTEKSEDCYPRLIKRRNPQGINDSHLSLDDEYNALYEKKTFPRPLKSPGLASSKDIEIYRSLVNDRTGFTAEIEKNNSGDHGINDSEHIPK